MNLKKLSEVQLEDLIAELRAEGIGDQAVQIATNLVAAIRTAAVRIVRVKAAQTEAARARKLAAALVVLGATKVCRSCLRTLALTEFPSSGHGWHCRRCNAERKRRRNRNAKAAAMVSAATETEITVRFESDTARSAASPRSAPVAN